MTNRLAGYAALLLPGALTAYLGFNAGGYFPNTTAFVAIVLAGVLAIRALLAREPFAGLSRAAVIVASALALYGAWTLISASWSNAPGRAIVELDRVLLYLLAALLFASFERTPERMRWLIKGVALGIVVVCLVALTTRVLPDVWPISPNLGENRLSYPLTYWNALGVLAAIGIVLCFHLASSLGEPRWARVTASGALPPLAAALLLTFSRGAIAAAILGLVVYAAVGRPRGLWSAVLATGPPTAMALVSAYDADLLAGEDPTSSAATAQGHDVALVVGLCVVGAIVLRLALIALDARLARLQLSPELRRPVIGSALAVTAVAAVVASLALDVPGRVADQYDRFVEGTHLETTDDLRDRLTDPGNNGRIDQWDVAIDDFERAKIEGSGAGTYQLSWAERRPYPSVVTDAHSLYVEVLGELGLVGAALLGLALLVIFAGVARRARGPDRAVYAAILAAGLAWAVHAGVDWDWEMPAVTLWLFALGGAALAAPAGEGRFAGLEPGVAIRVGLALACVALAVVPSAILLSQSRLDDSLEDFDRGDCPAAIDDARSSSSVLGMRPEPYAVAGYCNARLGRHRQAVIDMEKALDRDPDNWEYHYGLALVRAAAGLDPRPAARTALRLDPLEPTIQDAVRRFGSDERRRWIRQAKPLIELAFR